MEQNERRSGTGTKIPHPSAIEIHPALFDALAQSWSAANRNLLNIAHSAFTNRRNSSGLGDNSLRLAGLYLSETTPLSLHFGELRLPDFFGCHPARVLWASWKLATYAAAAFRFFPSNLFRTRIPLSMCFSSIRNGGRKRTTVSCVLLKRTPALKPSSTIGRAGISN